MLSSLSERQRQVRTSHNDCYALSVPVPLQKIASRIVPPAYLPLIGQMRFYIEPEISCSRFFGMACFTEDSIAHYRETSDISDLKLSELGRFIAVHQMGGLFIDIPCGLHNVRDAYEDFAIAPLAAALGATEVWETDITPDVVKDRIAEVRDILHNGYQLSDTLSSTGTRTENNIPVTTLQDDLLGFIAKIQPDLMSHPKTLYISAIQPDADFCSTGNHQKEIAVPYLTALYDEIARVSISGDLVILNSSSMLCAGIDEDAYPNMHPALALPPRGFTLMRRCAFDKVHVFRKD